MTLPVDAFIDDLKMKEREKWNQEKRKILGRRRREMERKNDGKREEEGEKEER